MAICNCSENCEHYVAKPGGLHRNCAARIHRWKFKKEIHEVMEYARKLDVRRGTLSYVVTKTQVAKQAIDKRKEVVAREEKERQEAERLVARRRRARKKGKASVVGRKTRRVRGSEGQRQNA